MDLLEWQAGVDSQTRILQESDCALESLEDEVMEQYTEDPTKENSSQGADHSADVSPDAAVTTPPRSPTISIQSITGRSSGSATATTSTFASGSSPLRHEPPDVDDDYPGEVADWNSPVPPLPKTFDISSFGKAGNRLSVLSYVTKRTEDDAYSSDEVARDDHMRPSARTISELMSGSFERVPTSSTHQGSVDVEPYRRGRSLSSKYSFDQHVIDQEADRADTRACQRRHPPQANASYLSHTQASKARQTDKVELAPSRRSSHGVLRDCPSQASLRQRSASALDQRDRSNGVSIRHGRSRNYHDQSFSHTSSRPSPDLSTSNGNASRLETNIRQGTSREGASVAGRGLSESPSSIASLHDETGNFGSHALNLQEELEQLQQQDDDDSSKSEASGDISSRLLGYDVSGEEVTISSASIAQHLSSPDMRHYKREIVQHHFGMLEKRMKELSHELERKVNEPSATDRYAKQAAEHLRTVDEDLEKLRQEVEELTYAIEQTSQASQDNLLNTEALNRLKQDSDSSNEITKLYTALCELISDLGDRLYSSTLNDLELRGQLANKENELNLALKALRDDAADTSVMSPKYKSAHDKITWKQAYKDMRQRKEQAEAKYESFKKTAEAMYRPDLERKNRELQIELNAARDELEKYREKVAEYRGRARGWEEEYKNAELEHEKCTAVFEQTLKEQRDEMLLYIRDYHDKTQDPEHWEISGLQRRIATLERDLQSTNEHFNTVKSEKARVEDKVEKLQDIKVRYERHIEELSRANIMGGAMPRFQTPDSDCSDSDTSSFSISPLSSRDPFTNPKPVKRRGPYIPRCPSPKEMKRREGILQDLREAQQQRREDEEKKIEIIEKVRKRHMQEMYPPWKEGWKQLIRQGLWKRWDGEEWLMVEASEEDRVVVEHLRSRGRL
ncbi:hypothetical protein EK21DRAFT_87553 [Setomelanomma holmii]|uniref:Uncharacterized protein n=1 Tax=Setomelanomma holmii TaxID=210430 RepID=A0A9P4HF81_9PLEO|nr:hypothetical protein EK21DRAFT_87553 [Setomelanomma holmii]